jgi:hypothetical protein
MSKLKLFFVYFFVDVFILLIPIIGWFLINNFNLTLDFSYFAWYLLVSPIIISLIILFFLRKIRYNVIFCFLSLFFVYILSYYIYVLLISEAFSKIRFLI